MNAPPAPPASNAPPAPPAAPADPVATPSVDLHAHWLLNGRWLHRPVDRPGPDRIPWAFLGNRVGLTPALQGGVHGLAFTAYDPFPRATAPARLRAVRAQVRTFHDAAAASGGRLRVARTGADIRAAAREGAVAGFATLEGGDALGGDPGRLEDLAALGLRMVTLVHFWPNALGDPAEFPGRLHGGLSAAGREVVRRMAGHGLIPDVAHLCDAGVRQALDAARGPVVSSHTGLRALAARPRNLPDDLVRAIAATGGLVGIILFPPYLDVRRPLRAPLEAFLDHACHAASLVGARHVAVGSDLDGWTWPPGGFRSHADWPLLARGLSRRGFSAAEVADVLGGNALRLLDA